MAIEVKPVVSPHLVVGDGAAAIDFYVKAFDAVELGRVPGPDGRLFHAALQINGFMVMLNDDFPEHRGGIEASVPGGLTLHLQVPDADAVWDSAVAAGATVKLPLENQFWGDRYGQLEDPFGFAWSIGGPKTE